MADDEPSLDGHQTSGARRRRGRKPVPAHLSRRHPVTCRLTDDELARADERRGALTRGEWLRRAALARLPRAIPAVNRDAWTELARLAANLNQVAHRLNVDSAAPGPTSADLAELRAAVQAVRLSLLGGVPDAEEACP